MKLDSHYLGRKLNCEIGRAHAEFHRKRSPIGRYSRGRKAIPADARKPTLEGELARLKALLGM